MNKKSILVITALLMMLSAAAQSKGVDDRVPRQQLSRVQPQFKEMDVQIRAPGEAVPSQHRSPEFLKPYYLRPAGAYYSPFVAINGVGLYSLGEDFIQVKPYSDYTYYSVINGADDNDEVIWDNSLLGEFNTYYSQHLTVNYGLEITETPSLYLYHSDLDVDEWFQYPYYMMDSGNLVSGRKPALIYSAPDASYLSDEDKECELLLSSKTMCWGGRNGDLTSLFVVYNDAMPFYDNTYGRWFGKNGGHYDGIAQAFEKPTHPYLLKKVYVQTADLYCMAPVQLCCKVYRLDEIPAYRDDEPVELSGDFGDPIAIGYTSVTSDTFDETFGLLTFTLYCHDENDPEVVYECNPTVDYPILVVFEDYNNPECDALRDFTCLASADVHVDEGYGELAYLKCPVNDVEGNFTGEYVWKGLNNLFWTGEMKTGYSIFIVADQPYLAFSNSDDGEYVFPGDGGLMQPIHPQVYGDDVIYPSIMFLSSNPSENWKITCNGSDELPDWLEIELVDQVDKCGEFTDAVGVNVTAAPLPDGVSYREAVVRFEIPGDYQDYKFKQIGDVSVAEQLDSQDAVAVDYYDIMGHKLQGLQQGLNIVMMSDGTVRKLFLK